MPPMTQRQDLPRPKRSCRTRWIGAGMAAAATSAGLLAAAASATAAGTLSTLLEQGSHSSEVAQVQRALHLHPASGRFGLRTKRAVRAFQRRDRLVVDGIVGAQTWDALFHITSAPARAAAAAGSGGAYSIPSGIVQCESHGNYSAVNASSGAGGAYQILPSTWEAYGGQGLPQHAPPAEQDRIAAEIYARQGPSAWTC